MSADLVLWHGWWRKNGRSRWKSICSGETAEQCHAEIDRRMHLGGDRLVIHGNKDPNRGRPRQGDLFVD